MKSSVRPVPITCVFGTRPDAIKMAPVVLALKNAASRFSVRVVVTGQHKEQLEQVLRVFEIVPDLNLAIMRHQQTLTQITTRALEGVSADLAAHPAACCLAQGDTTTTFVAALAAFYHKIPFGHVEAGLRTGNRYDPFPEEMNRRLAAALTTYHFAPTEQARQNLLREGIADSAIRVTGNTSIDALRLIADSDYVFEDPGLAMLTSGAARLILVTAHRRENWGQPMTNIALAVKECAERFADCEVVVSLHKNPEVRSQLRSVLDGTPRVHLIEPPDYVPFVKLMQRATLILTDSGGVQEEAPTFGVPVLVLRKTTERAEGIEAGAARLVGTDTADIVREAARLLEDRAAYTQMAHAVNPYGAGDAADQILAVLDREL